MYKNQIPADYLARERQNFRWKQRMETTGRNSNIDAAEVAEQLEAERERYLRLAADFDNHRKRVNRDLERRAASQKEALVRDLLPAIDNLERALGAKAGEDLREGVRMIYQQILEVLKRHGFEPREDLGQPFDGRFHDGIAVGFRPDMPELSVIEILERGWMRGRELFRPAKVLVNRLELETGNSEATPRAEEKVGDNSTEAVSQ